VLPWSGPSAHGNEGGTLCRKQMPPEDGGQERELLFVHVKLGVVEDGAQNLGWLLPIAFCQADSPFLYPGA
jgi:hypothetical protein